MQSKSSSPQINWNQVHSFQISPSKVFYFGINKLRNLCEVQVLQPRYSLASSIERGIFRKGEFAALKPFESSTRIRRSQQLFFHQMRDPGSEKEPPVRKDRRRDSD